VVFHDHTTPAHSSERTQQPCRLLPKFSLATSMVARETDSPAIAEVEGYANLLKNSRSKEKHRKKPPEAWYSLVNLPGGLFSLALKRGCVRVTRCQGKLPSSNNPLQGKASSPIYPRRGVASLISPAAPSLRQGRVGVSGSPGVKENHRYQITRCKEKHRYHEPVARKSIVTNNPMPLLALSASGWTH
jgi:hypothetical protein